MASSPTAPAAPTSSVVGSTAVVSEQQQWRLRVGMEIITLTWTLYRPALVVTRQQLQGMLNLTQLTTEYAEA